MVEHQTLDDDVRIMFVSEYFNDRQSVESPWDKSTDLGTCELAA